MNYNFKKYLKNLIPMLFIKKISNTFQYYSFKGDYKNFKEIKKYLTPYDSKKIIERVKLMYKLSKINRFLNDRDGEVSLKKNLNFKLLKYLCIFLEKRSSKNSCVIDFGGSLANFYRTNTKYLNKYDTKWIIIENDKICKLGNKNIKNKNLYFFENINLAHKFIRERNLQTLFFLFGSSIQYLDNFEKLLFKLKNLNPTYIIIDRQPILRSKATKCVIQKTPPWAGNLSFAVKLYNVQKLVNIINIHNFSLIDNFKAFGNQFKDGEYRVMIFKKHA
tara:strand:- start:6 stop:833 length:828 start_codon:yes stop_codon:yes gene_type:complete